jgi:hypothetical protein
LTTKPRQPKASAPGDTSGLRVFDVPTDEVIENPRNPRRITEEHVDRMAALLREFKLRAPILVSTSTAPYHLEDGHLRLRAAKKLGLPTIPAVDCSDLSATQMKALRIAVSAGRRLQLQERLVNDIARKVCEAAGTRSVAVIAEGEHLCLAARGARQGGALMLSSAYLGAFATTPELQAEFRTLALRP